MDNLKVQMLLEAIDKMSGPIQRIDQSVERLAGTERKAAGAAKAMGRANAEAMESMGRKAALMGAGIAAGIGGTLSAYAELEGHQARMQNAYTGVNGPSKFLKEINDQAIVAGNLYPGTTADFFEMATAMKQAGMAEDIIAQGGFKAAAALKVMFDLNPAEAGRQTVQLSKSFGIAGKDFEGFADSIQRMREASGMGLTELATAAPYISRVAKPLGIGGLNDAKQMLTIMGVLKQTGTEGSMVGTAIGGALEHLALMGPRLAHTRGAVMGEAKKILTSNKLDLQFFNKQGDFLGLANFVQQLDKLKVLKAEQRSIVGGAYFGQEGSVLAAAVGTTSFNEMAQKLLEQENLQTRLTRITDTLSAKTEALMGTTKNFAASLGSALGPTLKGILAGANSLVGALTDWTNAHPGLTAGVMGTIAALGGLLLVGGGSIWMISKITLGVMEFRSSLTILLPLLQTWTGTMGPLQGGMAGLMGILGPMLPLALLVAGAGLVVATNWDVAGDSFKQAGDNMAHAGSGLRDLLSISGEETKDAAKDLSYLGAVAMTLGNFADQSTYALSTLVDIIRVLKREMLDLLKIPAGATGSALATFGMSRAQGKGFWESMKDADKSYKSSQRDLRIESREKSLGIMSYWSAHNPFDFGAGDLAREAAKVGQDTPYHSEAEVAGRKSLRQSMVKKLKAEHLSDRSVAPGMSIEKLVGTIHIDSLDEATFTKQLLEAVKKKAPDLARELQRHLAVQQRGNLATAGANP